VFVDVFPMTESGKIKKAALREDTRQRLGASTRAGCTAPACASGGT